MSTTTAFRSAYFEKLKSPEWQRKRLQILNRDDFTCLDCGAKDKTLHVHHTVYINGKDPWDYLDEDLRTLCDDCHDPRHAIEHDVKLEFSRLMARLTREQLGDVMLNLIECKSQELANGVTVITNDTLGYISDTRWHMEAHADPSLRPLYEKVTGLTHCWGDF